MKKLLVILALFAFAALGAQDTLVQYWAGDASYNFHFFVDAEGAPAPDGWLLQIVLDTDGTINGIDPATLLPTGDDQLAVNNNWYEAYLNGLNNVGAAGTWYADGPLGIEDPTGSPAEPVINLGDSFYIVLWDAATVADAQHYCTSELLTAPTAAGAALNIGIENWYDTAWVSVGGPSFPDADTPMPADGCANVMTDVGMLSFHYDDLGSGVADFDVYFGSENPPMVIHETVMYDAGPGTYYVNVPELLANTTYYWSVEPTDGSRAVTRKSNVAQRAVQQSMNRAPVWSFTTEGEPVTEPVAGGGTPATFTFGDGTTVGVTSNGAGGNLEIIQYATPPADLLNPGNALPLWFDIDPTGAWTDFPVDITITWTTPAPTADDYFELVWFDGTVWHFFVDGVDGTINSHNFLAPPYTVSFTANHFTEYVINNGTGSTLPVTFSQFDAAFSATENAVMLTWITESETEMAGYHVLRSETNDVANAVRVTPAMVKAANEGTANEYNFTDKEEIELNTTYNYWIEAYELSGNSTLHGPVAVTTDGNDVPDVEITKLNAAYPNPFNPTTTISFSVKAEETGKLTIYNVLGQVVKTYPTFETGNYEIQWQGRDNNDKAVGSGIYFYKLETKSYNKIMKMLLLK